MSKGNLVISRGVGMLAAACLLCSCGDDKPAASEKPQAAAAAVPVDWAKVKVPKDGSHIVTYKMLARHLDVWYRGKQPTVRFTFNNGAAVDAEGHRMAFTDAHWKGLIEEAKSGGKLMIQAAVHQDAPAGEDNTRSIWEVTVVDPVTIDVKWVK